MSTNDPQWGGRRKTDGPPDLDEIWKNVNRRLNDLFGRKGGNGNEPPSSPDPRPSLPIGGMGLLIGLIVLVWLLSGFYIVNEGRQGVVFRFGKHAETTKPGLRWHLPYPIESVEIVYPAEVKTVKVGYRNDVKNKDLRESLMLTDDENIVDIQFAVQYELKSAEDYLFFNRSVDDAVKQVAETAIREIVGKNKMDFVLYEGKDQIADRTRKLMQQILDRYRTGVNVLNVTIQNVQPPEQVQASFEDAVKASQDRERQKNEGQAYYNDLVPKARGFAARLTEEASGYSQAVVANAEGEASRFRQILAEYNKAPSVTRDRLYLEAIQSVLGNTSKVLIDQKGGNNLLYLPLDKLLRQSDSGPSTSAEGVKRSDPVVTLEPVQRSRESLRGRDREGRQ